MSEIVLNDKSIKVVVDHPQKRKDIGARAKIVHISPTQDKWAVRLDSSRRARKILRTPKEAIKFVKPLQDKGYKVAVHDSSGMVDYMIENGTKYNE